MSTARIPVQATILVAVAVLAMIGLGLWQLQRADHKAQLKAVYAAAERNGAPVYWPADAAARKAALFRKSGLACVAVIDYRAIAGRNAKGEPGWAHIALCRLDGYDDAEVVLGWATDPQRRDWPGGPVTGTIVPGGARYARIVADPPLADLAASARPDPNDIPDNHRAYAVQWFLFALVALVIYIVALRRRALD